MAPGSSGDREVWVGGFSLRAGTPYFIASALLLALAAAILYYVIPSIRELLLYTFIGEVLARYIWAFTLLSQILAALGIALAVLPFLSYAVNEYRVTEKEVFCTSLSLKGVIRRSVERGSISDVHVEQGLLGRLLNYGNITITTPSLKVRLTGVERPREAAELIKKKGA